MDDFELGEAGKELDALQKKISELENENARMKEILKVNDLEDELEGIDCTSIEEKICVDGIRHISSKIEAQDYDDKDVKNFDTLYKTLRVIRGTSMPTKKTKPMDIKDLLKIVGSEK